MDDSFVSADPKIERIGPYRLVEPLGAGGMGTVWRAWDERLRRQVAIKRILAEAVSHASERFRREARAAARLNHPAIVHVYDLIEREDGDWIVMELVEGRTLRRLVAEDGPLAAGDAIRLGREIAEGLAEAHGRGILHRDLKTINVMVTPGGRAKILDFGLAKELRNDEEAAGSEPSLSATGTVIGTCHAMSPEQAMGLELNGASDLFSLGSLLYEALTGEPPFLAGSPHETLGRVLSFVPRPLYEVRPEIPRELSHLVARLLEKSPLRRPHSAEEVAGCLAALGAVSSPEGSAVREPSAGDSEATLDVRPPWLERPLQEKQPSSGAGRRWSSGERRRLTVVCCGLVQVDAAGEATCLDVEALSEAMEAFQTSAREVVERLGGRVGGVLGGHQLWFYFGYPRAHEDDARRAARAARTLAARTEQLGVRLGGRDRQKLAVRTAIHAGRAVIETRPGKAEQLQLGSTLDLAISLQNVAPAGGVVASSASQRLLARSFEMEALPPVHLPGSAEPEPVYEVRSELDHRGGQGKPLALVGRDQEIQLLLDRFRLARSGTGQAVMISGEAGIGKSSLLSALREGLAVEDAAWLVGYGSPYTHSTPLAPIIDLLERTIFASASAPSERRISRLEELLLRYDLPLPENAPLLASLLSVPTEGRYPPLSLTPEVQRKKTLEVLVALLAEMAERRPSVFALEDLHWIDPSTLELMDMLLEEITALPLMAVATFRPEFQAPWRHRAHVTQISLSRLTDGETEILIGRLAESRELPADVRRQIAAKTDGVPLFVEELTKAVLETGWSGGESEIPSTLDGSLMARLDRLGDAKEVAQLASVIGRVFSFELLAATSQLEEMALRRGLEELTQAELIYRRGAGPRARYVFKHALIQDAAYLSLLTSQRQQIHERIAHILEKLQEEQEIEPEILAHHFEKAGLIPQAVTYLQQAAQRAIQRSAYREVLSHCGNGIRLLSSLEATDASREQELALRSLRGVALIPIHGYASEEVAENAARCQQLCRELGDMPRLIPSLYGLWVYHLMRGHRRETIDVSEEIGRLSKGAEEHIFIGFSARGTTAFYQGLLEEANELCSQAMAIYTPALHPKLAQAFGDDSGLLPYLYQFWCLWLRGRPDAAVRNMKEAMRIARALSSPYVLVIGYLFEMILWHALREPEEVHRVAETFLELSREQQFPLFLALAKCGLGWTSLYRGGDPEAGIAQVRESMENHRLIGTQLPRAYWLTYLIEMYLAVGRVEEGLAVTEEALRLSETQLDVYYDAEVRRLRGELLLGLADPRGAEAELRQSLEIAGRQGARAFELRTVISLSRLLRDQGRAGEAHRLLADIYGSYQEGFETRDLREARQLLGELG